MHTKEMHEPLGNLVKSVYIKSCYMSISQEKTFGTSKNKHKISNTHNFASVMMGGIGGWVHCKIPWIATKLTMYSSTCKCCSCRRLTQYN